MSKGKITEKEEKDFIDFWKKIEEGVKLKEHISWDRLTNATDHIFNFLKENKYNWNDVLMVSIAMSHLSLTEGYNSLKNKDKNTGIFKEAIKREIDKNNKNSHMSRDLMLAVSSYHGKPITEMRIDISNSHMISTTLKKRFSILENYCFKCAYCGRSPPEVKLQIEHKKPKSKGGKDFCENLVPACFECNSGKGSRILKNSPEAKKHGRR